MVSSIAVFTLLLSGSVSAFSGYIASRISQRQQQRQTEDSLWRALKGLRPLADPMPLSPFARGQLILVIRLLDAQRDGASEREAAAVVLNAKADNRRSWIGSEHRTRLRRLLARGHKLLAGATSNCSIRRPGGGEGHETRSRPDQRLAAERRQDCVLA